MSTTPLPPFPKPDILSHVVTVWRDGVECEIDQGPRFTSDQMQAYATQARADLEAENARLKAVLKDVGLFLHHCWCDVQMNDYSFELLNKQMEAVDAALKDTK